IIIDDQQRILWFNPGAERILGYTADEVMGESLNIIFPPEVADRHHKHVENFLRSGITGREMGEFMELVAYRKNGEQFFVEATISKSEDRDKPLMMVILRDVTEARRREEELLYQSNLLDKIADAVVIIDHEQVIRRFNRGA